MPNPTLMIDGVQVSRFLYGTAWKEDATQRLTELALAQGFRGVDTANQRRHYDEAAVGRGIAASIASGLVDRSQLFVQTKFTFPASQDHRLPYDPNAPVAVQVQQSLESSLDHLGVKTIDSYLLHGPSTRAGLAPNDWAAWRAIEDLRDSGKTALIGISNVNLKQLQLLCDGARIPPHFVQNRCYAVSAWDRHLREFCTSRGIVYQAFSLLTANREALGRPELARIAQRHGRNTSQILFRFALDVGMLPLTGTSDANHMRADLDVFDFHLKPEEVQQIERLVAQ